MAYTILVCYKEMVYGIYHMGLYKEMVYGIYHMVFL